ncbi:hypothetical protein FRB94_009754 [Tulasnella sp. JGI-2019a]|nr:hypothetical protein FRB94_009754 [Tulasnella sp. JGI-2019a]KAG9000750.1 hypothetical protein FRB93_012576 [Tulasnella sp. JGI-2019a]KAG9026018.1 hypothetical protein FRB95_009501 [Tulasnella sp. JGI-2019a]
MDSDDQLPARQQGATQPDSGSTVPASAVHQEPENKLPFIKQVEAYAHIAHGNLTGNTEEKQQFRKVLAGKAPPPNDNPVFQDKNAPIPITQPIDPKAVGPDGTVEHQGQLPFKEQVRSYAHIHSSKVTRNSEEKEYYQKVLAGVEAPGPMKK